MTPHDVHYSFLFLSSRRSWQVLPRSMLLMPLQHGEKGGGGKKGGRGGGGGRRCGESARGAGELNTNTACYALHSWTHITSSPWILHSVVVRPSEHECTCMWDQITSKFRSDGVLNLSCPNLFLLLCRVHREGEPNARVDSKGRHRDRQWHHYSQHGNPGDNTPPPPQAGGTATTTTPRF